MDIINHIGSQLIILGVYLTKRKSNAEKKSSLQRSERSNVWYRCDQACAGNAEWQRFKDHQVWGSRDLVGGANLGPSVLRTKI